MNHPPVVSLLAILIGLFLIAVVLWEGFESVVLPRSVSSGLRFSRVFHRTWWRLTSGLARHLKASGRRELYLSYFGPLSLPVLMVSWAASLILGFALMQWAMGPQAFNGPSNRGTFWTGLYSSGVTFFTLGYGDITPRTGPARAVAVIESGTGFGFLALVLSYLPVLYQSFSRREGVISRMDGRASSPPSAGAMLRRHAKMRALQDLTAFLQDWERWASELLESHLSYPILAYYRSQHEHQSWLGAMTAILDTCALLMAGTDDPQGDSSGLAALQWQARMTFAMGRHAVIDLAYTFHTPPVMGAADRLPPRDLSRLRAYIGEGGLALKNDPEADELLRSYRALYEPYVTALAQYFLYSLPPWQPDENTADNWQTSAWDHSGNLGADIHAPGNRKQ